MRELWRGWPRYFAAGIVTHVVTLMIMRTIFEKWFVGVAPEEIPQHATLLMAATLLTSLVLQIFFVWKFGKALLSEPWRKVWRGFVRGK